MGGGPPGVGILNRHRFSTIFLKYTFLKDTFFKKIFHGSKKTP